MREGRWQERAYYQGTEIAGKVLGIVGYDAWFYWKHEHPSQPAKELILHGNVDLRQVSLAS